MNNNSVITFHLFAYLTFMFMLISYNALFVDPYCVIRLVP